jgi:GMP synthase-like glutamine amidotransferase
LPDFADKNKLTSILLEKFDDFHGYHMRIAFLHAGFPPEKLEPEYGSYLTMFQEAFLSSDLPTQWVDFRVQEGEFPSLDDRFDGYLCCGSANSVYDEEPWIKQLTDFVRTVYKTGGRMVGICFGHQLIAHALGGHVEKAKHGWGLGNLPGKVLASQSWMTPKLNSIDLLYSHQDQVVLPPRKARLLINTDHCPLAAFAIDNRFLTFQGHPEFRPDYLNALMEERRERIDSRLIDQAKLSLKHNLHNQTVMAWIINFYLHQD